MNPEWNLLIEHSVKTFTINTMALELTNYLGEIFISIHITHLQSATLSKHNWSISTTAYVGGLESQLLHLCFYYISQNGKYILLISAFLTILKI